jgi:hypothetical protein
MLAHKAAFPSAFNSGSAVHLLVELEPSIQMFGCQSTRQQREGVALRRMRERRSRRRPGLATRGRQTRRCR